jgi:hypothetical protein
MSSNVRVHVGPEKYSPNVGTWGEEPFESEQAVDFVPHFKFVGAQAGLDLINGALAAAADVPVDEYLEEDPAAEALAAAGVLAAAMGRPIETSSFCGMIATDWVSCSKPAVPSETVALAHRALLRIVGPHSELADLWDEQSDHWRASLMAFSTTFAS